MVNHSKSTHISGDYLFETIKRYTKHHKIFAAEFCRSIGWKPQYLQAMKGSRVYLKNIIKAAEGMNIPVDMLLGEASVSEQLVSLPAEVEKWIHTREGSDYLVRGYAAYKKKQIEEKLRLEKEAEEKNLASDLEKAVFALYPTKRKNKLT